ncbi:MAG: hypothetical protein MK135_06265, partial [Polyangiaceae bacterium]|nr:hypothetical protein [Polyangiaceae bacterium]
MTELYAGVGSISLGMVNQVGHLILNEVGPGSLRGLRQSLSQMKVREDQVQILTGPAEDCVQGCSDA